MSLGSPDSKKSRLLQSSVRADLNEDEIVKCLISTWASSSNDFVNLKSNGIEIIHDPFPVCIVHNFINNSELLQQAAVEAKEVVFHEKCNDLYQFKQSDDLRNFTNFAFISQLYDVIRIDGRTWVDKIIGGGKLNQDISATFSSYTYQDRLLCHDDKCEDRHIAFILYLVEDWNEKDGGSLELFSTDKNGYPSEIVKSICPEFNTMVFFEVTHKSFHQVSEVNSRTKERLSLNGWFHSSGKKLSKISCEILENESNVGNDIVFSLADYFSSTYLDIKNTVDIKNIFSNESEIQLNEFVLPNFYNKIESELRSDTLKWIFKGPANIRKYECGVTSTLPASLKTLKDIFTSECWFKHLKSITGLDLAPSATSDLEMWERGIQPRSTFEVQRWTHSCYTLIHDRDPEFHSEGLDVILRVPLQAREGNESEQNEDIPQAGHIIYIDAESRDEECLLHIGYKANSLGLIFRDTKTLRFTKYLDSTAEPFYQIFCTYQPWRPPPGEPNLRHCEEDSETEDSTDDCQSFNQDDSPEDE